MFRNKIRIILMLLVIFLTVSNEIVKASQTTEYFRHLVFRESPLSQHKGIYPITQKEAKQVAHYRFDYDEEGRVVEISFRIGDDLIALNGNWDSFTWWSSKIAISYSEGQEEVTFYNRHNEVHPGFARVTKAIYEVDEDGKRVAVHFLNNGEKAENHWNVHRYEWSHLGNGEVLEQRFNLKGEPVTLRPNLTFYTVKLAYGEDDMLDFMYHINEDGELINNTLGAAIDRIVFDQHGNFSRWMVFDENRELAEGNDPQLALGENLYDQFGNKVVLRGYDVYMNPKAMPNGVAYVKRKYDRFGNLTEEAYRDINNVHIVREVSIFSENGKRKVGREFRDDNGNLENFPGVGFAREEIVYNENGRFVESKRYKVDGTQLEGDRS